MLYTIVSSSAVVCTFLLILLITNIYTNHVLHAYKKNVDNLQVINQKQAMEIKELKNKATTVSEKLSILSELESKVRAMVGLASDNDASAAPISRSFSREQTDSDDLQTSLDMSDDKMENLEVLAAEMDNEIEHLFKLIDDVDGQLKNLEKLPDLMPTEGRITSKFGYRKSPFTGKRQFHKGLDISNDKGTDIVAAASGIVTFSDWNAGYGRTVIISHGNSYRSVYAHNSENLVIVGQKVKKGDKIAKMGSTGRSTGPHLHFEIHYKGEQIDPETVLK